MSRCAVLFQFILFMSSIAFSWGIGWRLCSPGNNSTDCCISGLHTLRCPLHCPIEYFQSDKNCDHFFNSEEDQHASTQVALVTTTESAFANSSKLLNCCESVVLTRHEGHDPTIWVACLLGGMAIGITATLAAVLLHRRYNLKREHKNDILRNTHHLVSSLFPVLPPKMIDPRPVFSPHWQIRKEVTSKGATLRKEDSDVYLTVPYGAVDASDTVIIEAAIFTNIQEVYGKFEDLIAEEYVASPVVEYTTSNNYRFQQSVMVTLPHFLPPSFSKDCVQVYQFSRGLYGKLELTQLKHLDVDDLQRDPTAICCLHKDVCGVFFFGESDQIHILTNHFTGFFCTDCKQDYPIQQIYLEVHGGKLETSEDGAVVVDIRLEAFDRRISIKDFETNRPDRLAANYDNMRRLDLKVLPSPAENTDPKLVFLGVRLELMSTQDEQVWMHSQVKGGEQLFPTENTINLTRLVPCRCRTLPERIDWQLTSRKGVRPRSDFRCFIDAGYVTSSSEDAPTIEFLRNPKCVRFNVRLECVTPTFVRSWTASSSAATAAVEDTRRTSTSETGHAPPERTSGTTATYRWNYRNSAMKLTSETHKKEIVDSSTRPLCQHPSSPDFFGDEYDAEAAVSRKPVSRENSGFSLSSPTIVIESLKGHVNFSMNGTDPTRETTAMTNPTAARESPTDVTETLGDGREFSTPVPVSDDE